MCIYCSSVHVNVYVCANKHFLFENVRWASLSKQIRLNLVCKKVSPALLACMTSCFGPWAHTLCDTTFCAQLHLCVFAHVYSLYYDSRWIVHLRLFGFSTAGIIR